MKVQGPRLGQLLHFGILAKVLLVYLQWSEKLATQQQERWERPCLSSLLQGKLSHTAQRTTHTSLPAPSACTSPATSQPLLLGGPVGPSRGMEHEPMSNLGLHDCATFGFEHPFGPLELKSYFLLRASCIMSLAPSGPSTSRSNIIKEQRFITRFCWP